MAQSKSEMLNTLFTKYNLVFDASNPNSKDNDVYIHKHYKIITRGGIQKIEKSAGINCSFEVINSAKDFIILRGHGYLPSGVQYTTFASASSETTQNGYYAEMAEKRCRSRLVLTLAGLYELGVFGEDESDDFSISNTQVATFKK